MPLHQCYYLCALKLYYGEEGDDYMDILLTSDECLKSLFDIHKSDELAFLKLIPPSPPVHVDCCHQQGNSHATSMSNAFSMPSSYRPRKRVAFSEPESSDNEHCTPRFRGTLKARKLFKDTPRRQSRSNTYSASELKVLERIANQLSGKEVDEISFVEAMSELGIDFQETFPSRKVCNLIQKMRKL